MIFLCAAAQAEQVTHETDGQGSRPYITKAFERQPPRSDAPGSDRSSDRSEVQDSSDDTTANGQLGTIQLIIGTAGHGTFTKCKRQVRGVYVCGFRPCACLACGV